VIHLHVTYMKKDLDVQLGRVKASRYRRNVLMALMEGPQCPKEIAAKLGYYDSHVSKTLTELGRDGLAICKNPNATKGRLYRLTADGKAICAMLSKCDK